jgi:uncharacterized membrane protein
MMSLKMKCFLAIAIVATLAVAGCGVAGNEAASRAEASPDRAAVAQGKEIFRMDTFGNESFWTDTLRASMR